MVRVLSCLERQPYSINPNYATSTCRRPIYAGRDPNLLVGYSIDTRMKSSLARAAMRNAIALRSPDGTICHSDRGGQFRAKRTQNLLRNNGLVGSMGRSYGA